MENQELKDRIDTLVKQIKTNSKDAHFAERLIDELLSVKGQLSIEVTELDCGKKIDEFLGETFRLTLTDRGILYHEYGGYNIFVTPNITALYESLADMVINRKFYEGGSDEQKERLELSMTAVGWCLQAPKIALTDASLTFDVATLIIRHMNKMYKEATDAELQEETIKEDSEFRDAAIAADKLKETAAKADNGD